MYEIIKNKGKLINVIINKAAYSENSHKKFLPQLYLSLHLLSVPVNKHQGLSKQPGEESGYFM